MGRLTVIPWLPLPELMITGISQPLILASEPAAAHALALILMSVPKLMIVLPILAPQSWLRSLMLINDDVNTFEYVIDTLMKVCHHTHEQAETCAWITHYKGKCAILHGSFEELKPYYDTLLAYHLTVKIES